MKACGGMEICLNIFLNEVSALDAGEWSFRFTSPSPYSLEKIRFHQLNWRLIALQSRSVLFDEENYHAALENRTMIPRLSSP